MTSSFVVSPDLAQRFRVPLDLTAQCGGTHLTVVECQSNALRNPSDCGNSADDGGREGGLAVSLDGLNETGGPRAFNLVSICMAMRYAPRYLGMPRILIKR